MFTLFQDQSVSCSLGILAGWRRRQQALLLLNNLETIRTLSLTQVALLTDYRIIIL